MSKGKNKISKKQRAKAKYKLLAKELKAHKKLLKKEAKRQKKQALAKRQINALNMVQLKESLPAGFGGSVTDDTLSNINKMIEASTVGGHLKEHIIGFTDILTQGKYSFDNYVTAVNYVTCKMMGLTNEKSYAKTFPERWKKLSKEGKSDKQKSVYVTIYNRGQLVQKMLAQTLTPIHVFYNDHMHKAITTQTRLLRSHNEIVAQRAADSLMNHLKPPEATEVNLNIRDTGLDLMAELAHTTAKLAKQQMEDIKAGRTTAKVVAGERIIKGLPE